MEYTTLGKTGVIVSKLCFGTMTFGGRGFWEAIGKQTMEEVNKLIATAYEAGINFIDTANVYSEGESERLLGNAISTLGLPRQELFVATKVRGQMGNGKNQVGLTKLHIMDSVNDSLRRLQLEHIDLLYIHGVDVITPIEETMRGLEDVVRSGKVRYIGCCNIPAWMVTKANGLADKHGWNKFVALQYYYTIAGRDVERELVPMAESEGLALMPWSPLAGGFLTGKYTRGNQKAEGDTRRNAFDFPPVNKEKAYDIMDKMAEVAKDHNATIAQIALAWLLHRKAVTSIIIGAKTDDQLKDNLKSVDIKLTSEELSVLDKASALVKEYPQWMMERQNGERVVNR